ncbi:MAG TPA: hypothetical protein VGX24_04180 [Pyrinomonadaceae bacterium]|nr:hypothetical protein [Pyrinomonadaceae bacterium]
MCSFDVPTRSTPVNPVRALGAPLAPTTSSLPFGVDVPIPTLPVFVLEMLVPVVH